MSTLNAGETLQPFKPLRNNLIFDSSGNLVGIQNDRANGNDFRIGGGSGVDGTFATLVATTALTLNAGATFNLYNTADQTTNYERLRADWSGNVARIYTDVGGTGTYRNLTIGLASAGNPLITLSRTGQGVTVTGGITTGGNSQFIVNGQFSTSTSTVYGAQITPTINQSGTAGYTALDVNPTESATGSGTKLLQRWAVGGVLNGAVNNVGEAAFAAVYVPGIGFTAAVGSFSSDLILARDAANVLAQRNGTNAQTFRLYETYTDASNYSRLNHELISNIWRIQSSAAGTGTARDIAINAGASLGAIYLQTSATTRWQIGGGGGGGNLLAGADNAYDIGASGAARPRNIYVAGFVQAGGTIAAIDYLKHGSSTVAGLSSAATVGIGTRFIVTDATATTYASIVAGGGANTVPVYSDGTNWRIG